MPMYSACSNAALPALGFPIRESTDHRLFSAYPWLIAAVHALHRLLVPRHPPCALKNLATKMLASTVQFSNNNRNHPSTIPPTPNTRKPTHMGTQPADAETRMARERNKQKEASSAPPARPLRTQQRTYSPPTPSPPFPTPTTHTRRSEAMTPE